MGKNVLKEIVALKRQRIAQAASRTTLAELKEKAASAEAPLSLTRAIVRKGSISLIAEIKRASPSRGILRAEFDHRMIAEAYKQAGVQALSVLTEEDHFQGSLTFLQDARRIAGLPVLRKDFILEPYQIYESRAWGADAVLLIAQCLSLDTLSELTGLAQELGMECLVEVHTQKELNKVVRRDLPLIGINNRDLRTLEVDPKTTERLFPLIPKEKTVVVESGIAKHQDVLFLKILGVSAVLVGSAFMEAADIVPKVEEVMGW